MDSLTQAALGGVCGELVLGRRLGNVAIVHGLVVGLLPDLDVAAFPWLDGVEQLAWHRGLSHSLLFCVVASPLLGALVQRTHRGRVTFGLASWFAFLALATHVLIDCFTVYGTQVLQPFAATRVAWNNLFIVDPLFTGPLVLALLAAPWLAPGSPQRRRVARIGVGLSGLYVLASFGLKTVADERFERAIAEDGIVARRWMSAPMPATTLYWQCLVDEGDRFRIGHTAILDPGTAIEWRTVPRRAELVAELRGTRALEAIDWFADGYWAARITGGQLVLSDLRFGDLGFGRRPAPGESLRWVFDFEVIDGGADLRLRETELGDLGPALRHVARRALGS